MLTIFSCDVNVFEMFLKDIFSGFPGGFVYYDEDLKKTLKRNSFKGLLIFARSERYKRGFSTANLETLIQDYICSHADPSIASTFCTDGKPVTIEVPVRRCKSCGGGKKR